MNQVFLRWPLIKDHRFHDPFNEQECHVAVEDSDEGVTRCRRPPWEHFKFCSVPNCGEDCW